MIGAVDDGVLVASLRDRAEAARGEGTATAQGDAWYFDKSADAILALRADVTRLTASLAAAEGEVAAFIESMDYPRMSPDAEEARCYDEMLEYMGRCWEARAALTGPAS